MPIDPEAKTNTVESSTINDYKLKYDRDIIRHSDLFFKTRDDYASSDTVAYFMNNNSLLEKYRTELAEMVIDLELSIEDQELYKCNPKALSYDIYKTTELWSLILELNELHTASQFVPGDSIKVYDSRIYDILSTIIDRERMAKAINDSMCL